MICTHCQTVGEIYFCTACGDMFFSEQATCPVPFSGHEGAVVSYEEHFQSELALALSKAEPPDVFDAVAHEDINQQIRVAAGGEA